ncbi:hypothetical protein V565_160520 [Rhizoctonia solani 123E]|uniref:HNH nuclease domain-containing protein n=1 Tax=Rhizoctonia solani 123E TaxID=1423351 RepID=A0A074RKI2_9AGAM|nr:hypothetical protein V565_160520 [Rhizoctonia solani 123E]
MFATPLPSLDGWFEDIGSARDAYQRILALEHQSPVCIRILGYMLIHAPNNDGRLAIAQDINACATDQDVFKLGQSFFKHFASYFKFFDISSSLPPSPNHDIFGSQIVTTPTTYPQAKNNALIRDNYRCMLTNKVDLSTYSNCPALQEQLGVDPPPNVDITGCWHIIPQFVVNDNQGEQFAHDTMLKVLERFGGISHLELNNRGIHHWTNIMTVDIGVYQGFNLLDLWLDPVEGTDNTYTIRKRFPGYRQELPQTVHFTTSTPDLPLPNPRYLALHAACARVVHLSGASEAISSIIRKMEQTPVLSEDGSSAELLEIMLSVHSTPVA